MCDALSAKVRQRHTDMNPQRTQELNSAKTLREGFANMGLEGWKRICVAGIWGWGVHKRSRVLCRPTSKRMARAGDTKRKLEPHCEELYAPYVTGSGSHKEPWQILYRGFQGAREETVGIG